AIAGADGVAAGRAEARRCNGARRQRTRSAGGAALLLANQQRRARAQLLAHRGVGVVRDLGGLVVVLEIAKGGVHGLAPAVLRRGTPDGRRPGGPASAPPPGAPASATSRIAAERGGPAPRCSGWSCTRTASPGSTSNASRCR